ncbi:MAG: membrane bound O-acyl transferase family-domain-containing protein [Planctomycetota bacterium]
MWFIYWFVLYLSTLFYDYFILRGKKGTTRFFLLLISSTSTLTWPLFVPDSLLPIRFIFAIMSFGKIIKTIEIAYGRLCDPKMLESFARYLIWSFNIADTFWAETFDEKRKARSDGRIRIGRGLLKTLLFLGFLVLSTSKPELHSYFWLSMFWFLWCCYFAASGFGDIATGMVMQLGVNVSPIFNRPFMARSPRDFWSRRWNLCFRDISYRNIFLPLHGHKRPLLATFLVFLMSGIVHEYIIFSSVGFSVFGGMLIFFMLQWIATVLQTVVAKKMGKKELMPKGLAVSLHILWLLLTIPFFAIPFLKVLPVTTWRLW